jgi:glucokinase
VALHHYLDAVNVARLDTICLAVAGPVIGGSVSFTNHVWQICAADLAHEFEGAQVKLLNDFEAVAHALPHLGVGDLLEIGRETSNTSGKHNSRFCTIGPGTGLGCAGLISQKRRQSVIVSEAGQVGFAPQTPLQMEVLALLATRFGRISNERLLSGPGIENLYWAQTKINGTACEPLSAVNIFTLAGDSQAGKSINELARQTQELFFEILGQVAGDLALSLYAIDGLYIAGGIVRRYPEVLANSLFREGFESKGEYRDLMEHIPTKLIKHENPGLLGAARFVLEM